MLFVYLDSSGCGYARSETVPAIEQIKLAPVWSVPDLGRLTPMLTGVHTQLVGTLCNVLVFGTPQEAEQVQENGLLATVFDLTDANPDFWDIANKL